MLGFSPLGAAPLASTGDSGITVNFDVTTATLTTTSTSTVDIVATSNVTTSSTLSAAASVPVNATSTVVTATLTTSATAGITVQGTLTKTLDDITESMDASVLVTATANLTTDNASIIGVLETGWSAFVTTDSLTTSSTASVLVLANVIDDIDTVSSAASASVLVTANSSVSIAEVSESMDASIAISATVIDDIDAFSVTSTGSLPIVGTSNLTLDNFVVSATGSLPVIASSTVSYAALTISAASTLPVIANFTNNIATVTLTAAGSVAVVASLTDNLDDVSITAVTAIPVIGELDQTLNISLISIIIVAQPRVNLNTNYNVNAPNLTNMTVQRGAVITRVDLVDLPLNVQTALVNKGLDAITSNVFKVVLDGSNTYQGVTIGGTLLANTPGTLSAYTYVEYGTAHLGLNGTSNMIGATALASDFNRTVRNNIQSSANRVMRLGHSGAINTPSVFYFVLNQLEEGSFVTSPIITQGASGVRYPDVASYEYTPTTSGWIKAEFEVPANTSTYNFILASDSAARPLVITPTGVETYNGATTLAKTHTMASGAILKVCLSWGPEGRKLSVNGSAVNDADTIGTWNTIYLGADNAYTTATNLHGYIKTLQIGTSALTENELNALTV